jgi:hypothetical protein
MGELIFYGKTETDIQEQFAKWKQGAEGSVRHITRHRIERLPLNWPPLAFGNQPVDAVFPMLVGYEPR